MRIGKLGEGAYLLTIGPSGRTIRPAKMVKAIKKTQEVREETQNAREKPILMREAATTFPLKDWWTTAELARELGVSVNKIYQSGNLLAQYISRPDGRHYLYHRDLLEDKHTIATLKNAPKLPTAEQMAPTRENTALQTDHETTETKPVQVEFTPDIDHAVQPEPEIVPIVVNRKVYCKELDRTFGSVTDGAKAIGARRESLSKALRAGQRCRGYTFTYVDEEHEAPVHRKAKKAPTGCAVPKKVFCVDLNRAFNSLQEGAEAIGSTAAALSEALRNGHRCKGHIFKYVDDPQRPDVQTRPVYCKELDKTFPSIHAAAKAINRSEPTLIGAIEQNYLCGGYHFSYA